MKKNIQIVVAIDDVDLVDIALIQESLEKLLSDYDDKRITMQIQDEPLVKFR